MSIAIIVPVYKVEKYLSRCVDSILNQTYQDFELILVNDGSPDNCGKICDEYAEKDNRIYVIHKENGGLSDARNAGLDWMFANSKSEWLTFVDSDDWIHPQYLEVMLDAVINNGALMSICNYVQANELSSFNMISDYDVILKESEEAYVDDEIATMPAFTKLYSRVLWKDLRFPKGKLHEDAYITHIPIFSAKKIATVHEKLYFYYYNETGIMNSSWSPKRMDELDAWKKRLKYLKQNNYKNAYKKDLQSFLWIFIQRLSEIDKKKYNKYIVIIKLSLIDALIKSQHSLNLKQKRDFFHLIRTN